MTSLSSPPPPQHVERSVHGDPSADPNLLSATSVLGAEAVDGQQVELRDEVCPSLLCVCVSVCGGGGGCVSSVQV